MRISAKRRRAVPALLCAMCVMCAVALGSASTQRTPAAFADVIALPTPSPTSPSPSPTLSGDDATGQATDDSGALPWVAGVGGGVAVLAFGAWFGLRRIAAARPAGQAPPVDAGNERRKGEGDEP